MKNCSDRVVLQNSKYFLKYGNTTDDYIIDRGMNLSSLFNKLGHSDSVTELQRVSYVLPLTTSEFELFRYST